MAESLIPYTKTSKRRPLSIKGILPSGVKLGPSVIFVLIIFFIYIGTFAWRIILEKKLDKLTAESNMLLASLQSKEAKELQSLASTTNIISEAIEQHIYPSQIFEPFEKLSHTNVALNSFNWSLEKSIIKVEGFTSTFETLGQQFLLWKNDIDFVEDIELDSFDKNVEGQISFSATIQVKKSLVHKGK